MKTLYRSIYLFLFTFALMSIAFVSTALAADTARMGVVVADKVNIRKDPSSEAEIIGRYSQDTRIVITGSKGSYFQVNYNGATGYVSDEFAVAYDYDKGRINASNVNLREGPNTDSDVVTTADRGDTVYVYGNSGEFYRVTYGQKAGYISKDFIDVGGSSSEGSSSSKSSSKSEDKKEEKTKSYSRSVKTGGFSEEELYLIAQVVYCEGRGSGSESYRALASVIYNRVASKRFPNSVEGVVFQDGQFSVCNNREKFLATKPDRKSQDAVYSVFIDGELTLPADVCYFKSDRLSKDWGGSREYYATIGGNMYYT